jgi:hypothetical protein
LTGIFAAFFTAFLAAGGEAFTALRADFAAAGDAGLDFAEGFAEDLARDFLDLDETLAMASRRCVRETAGGLHHGLKPPRKPREGYSELQCGDF